MTPKDLYWATAALRYAIALLLIFVWKDIAVGDA